MNDQIYVHYGSTSFDPTKNFPIHNLPDWIKPGGLWGSRINATYGWKHWCEVEEYEHTDFNKSFKFRLKENVKLVTIKTVEDLRELPRQEDRRHEGDYILGRYLIDFEKCLESGIDAIEICYYGDEYADGEYYPLHYNLYGWDCDSIVILNPNVVEQLEV